jgi:hypothetical protein
MVMERRRRWHTWRSIRADPALTRATVHLHHFPLIEAKARRRLLLKAREIGGEAELRTAVEEGLDEAATQLATAIDAGLPRHHDLRAAAVAPGRSSAVRGGAASVVLTDEGLAGYFALFSIVSIRERRRFWASMPSRTLLAALALDGIAGTLLSTVGLPSFRPLPWSQTLLVFVSAMVFSLFINDSLKVALMKKMLGGAYPGLSETRSAHLGE